MTQDTPQDRDSLITFITSEIETIRAQNSRPGWTIWALLGALAACGWLALGEFEKSSFLNWAVINSIWVSLGLLLVFPVISRLWAGQPFNRHYHGKVSSARTRVHRSCTLLRLVLNLAMIAIVVYYPLPFVSDLVLNVTLFCFGFEAFSFIVLLSGSFADFPLPFSGHMSSIPSHGPSALAPSDEIAQWMWRIAQRMRRITQIVFCFHSLLCAVCAYLFLYSLYHSGLVLTIGEVKVVALGVASFVVLKTLAHLPHESPAMGNLIQLRRDLSLGKSSVDFARKQADFVLYGLSPDDYYADKIAKLASWLGQFQTHLQIARAKMDAAQVLGPKVTTAQEALRGEAEVPLVERQDVGTPSGEDHLPTEVPPAERQAIIALHDAAARELAIAVPLMLKEIDPFAMRLRVQLVAIRSLAGTTSQLEAISEQSLHSHKEDFNRTVLDLFNAIKRSQGVTAASEMIIYLNKVHPKLRFRESDGRVINASSAALAAARDDNATP